MSYKIETVVKVTTCLSRKLRDKFSAWRMVNEILPIRGSSSGWPTSRGYCSLGYYTPADGRRIKRWLDANAPKRRK